MMPGWRGPVPGRGEGAKCRTLQGACCHYRFHVAAQQTTLSDATIKFYLTDWAMRYRLPPLPALRAFEASARHLSFKRAAAELFVTPAAVSQQIKVLEAYLGVSLFRRAPGELGLTEAGRAMLPRVREGLDALAAAVTLVQAPPENGLTVHAPPSFAQRWLVPRLSRFAAKHPDVALRLASDVCNIDGPGHGPEGVLANPRDAGSAVAIRFGKGVYPGFCSDLLLQPEYVLVCSPDLLGRSGPLSAPVDLGRQILIHDESIPDETMRPSWAEWFRLAGVADVDCSRGPRFSSAVLVLEAALGGQGVALALWPLVEADVRSGRLVVPFPVALPSRYVYSLVAHDAVQERPVVRDFRAWLMAEAGLAAAGPLAPMAGRI